MEEILASIRRIIADEEKPAKKPEPEPTPQAETVSEEDLDKLFATSSDGDEEEDVLDLTEEAVAPDIDMVDADEEDEDEDLAFKEVKPVVKAVAKPEAPPPPPPRRPAPPLEADRLISAATDQAVQHAFGSLSSMVVSRNARTIEDLVQDMLRPMLKSWLDENLPTMVERMVRAEIERVARGR